MVPSVVEESSQLVVEGSEDETGSVSTELDSVARLQTELLHTLQHHCMYVHVLTCAHTECIRTAIPTAGPLLPQLLVHIFVHSCTHHSTIAHLLVYYITATVGAGELQRLKITSTEIEASLKEISTANQTERKRLVSAHHSLSQQTQNSGQSNQSLRTQLTSLAARQKTLLECYKSQKEVVQRLEVLVHRHERGRAECERNESGKTWGHSTAAIPNLLQHLKPCLPQQKVLGAPVVVPSTAHQSLSEQQHHTLTGVSLTAVNSTTHPQLPSSLTHTGTYKC